MAWENHLPYSSQVLRALSLECATSDLNMLTVCWHVSQRACFIQKLCTKCSWDKLYLIITMLACVIWPRQHRHSFNHGPEAMAIIMCTQFLYTYIYIYGYTIASSINSSTHPMWGWYWLCGDVTSMASIHFYVSLLTFSVTRAKCYNLMIRIASLFFWNSHK